MSGPVGTLVTLTATDTDLDLSTINTARVGGTNAIVVSKEKNFAKIFVMPGTVTGTIQITSASGDQASLSALGISPTIPVSKQQGNKIVGTGNIGNAQQGYSVSVSADGDTAIVGGRDDNTNEGAAWIFTRSAAIWSQQAKLIGTGNTGAAQQGTSVAINADGNTAIIGGYQDNSNQGAAWIFMRTGTTWTQQGNKLVGTGNSGAAQQGNSVAISADGNTVLVGGNEDNGSIGAAWVFSRSAGVWSQQGTKLVGTGNTGNAFQGYAVALSADGNTALAGGYQDNSNQGAAWVFVRSGGTWTQQGAKLVGTGNSGAAQQSYCVALSADGNTAIMGATEDNTSQGAAWVFARSGTTWSQQGSKLVGTGNTGAAVQGSGVGLSADGNLAVVSGSDDNTGQGAVWLFARSGNTWTQQGSKLVGTGNTGAAAQGHSVALSADGKTMIAGGRTDNTTQGAAWIFVP